MKVSDLYENYRVEAEQYASGYGITPQSTSAQWDAFRHAYASASMANEYGYAVAEMAGYAVELGGFLKGNSLESSNMDLWNNNVGRDIGINSTTKDEMAQKVFDALSMGKLITDEANDPRNYFENYPNDPFPDNHTTIPSNMNDLYRASKNWTPPRRDPLVLDLDGDGIETLGITSTTQVLFDYDGDGVKTGTGWIKADDGFVVLDRNGNGTIDNGGELFGDQTLVGGAKASDGFAALSAEEEVNCEARETTLGCTNHNSKFDAGEEVNDVVRETTLGCTNFTRVRIWQDTNADGISQTSELKTLTEMGVVSISLASTNNQNFNNTRRVA